MLKFGGNITMVNSKALEYVTDIDALPSVEINDFVYCFVAVTVFS